MRTFAVHSLWKVADTHRFAVCLLLLSALGLPSAAQAKPRTTVRGSLTPSIPASKTGKPATKTRLSEAQVLQIARVFCRKVGLPITVPGTAKFVPNPDINPGTYWQSRWQLEFPGQARVEVADATGIITEFSNERYSIVHMHDTDPPGKPISQEEAILRSKQALAATGQLEPIKFRHGEVIQMSYHPYAKANFWSVDWDRLSGGVPYHDQHAGVAMDAQTGEIEDVVLVFPTPPLVSARKVLTQENAMQQAASIIVNQGIEQSASHTDTLLEIVQVGPGIKTVRLAWISTFVVDGHWRQVYLDAETGVLGDGAETATVPAELKVWIQRKLDTVSARDK